MLTKNKLFKGAAAGVTGVALLAGGFTSFAAWSETEPLPADSISTGILTVATTPGSESYVDGYGNVIDPATFQMVPGDTVVATVPLNINSEGDNMKASLSLDDKLQAQVDTINTDAGAVVLTVSHNYNTVAAGTGNITGVATPVANTPLAFNHVDGTFSVNGAVTFVLSADATTQQAQDADVLLSSSNFVVTQTGIADPTPAV